MKNVVKFGVAGYPIAFDKSEYRKDRLNIFKWLSSLGLDVFEEEPPKKSPLFMLENVVITPHTAAHTYEATTAMADMSVQNLIDVLSGRDCPYTV